MIIDGTILQIDTKDKNTPVDLQFSLFFREDGTENSIYLANADRTVVIGGISLLHNGRLYFEYKGQKWPRDYNGESLLSLIPELLDGMPVKAKNV